MYINAQIFNDTKNIIFSLVIHILHPSSEMTRVPESTVMNLQKYQTTENPLEDQTVDVVGFRIFYYSISAPMVICMWLANRSLNLHFAYLTASAFTETRIWHDQNV